MKKIAEGTRQAWQLFEDKEEKLILSVLCGSIGMYEVKMTLSDAEARHYRQHGVGILDDLAYRLSRDSAGSSDGICNS